MHAFIIAAGWDEFLKILPFIIVLLVWVINQFGSKIAGPAQPPNRVSPVKPPVLPPAGQAAAPKQAPGTLQTEIDEFLRQAQAMREGRAVPPRKQQGAAPEPTAAQRTAQTNADAARRQPRTIARTMKTDAERDRTAPQRPIPALAKPEAERPRETVAQYVAEHIDSSKFNQLAKSLSSIDKETDDFQKHMARVFDTDLNKKAAPLGMFEAAGAASAAANAAAALTASAAAAGAETATAPVVVQKAASNISLFLAGRKNIRDAIILKEILDRPESRWGD